MIESCIACGASTLREIGSIEGYVAGDTYRILSCQTCFTHMSSPHRSENRVYEWIYKNRNITPGYVRYAKFAEDVLSVSNPLKYLSSKEEMYYGVSKIIHDSLPKGGTILDIGCGLGYFTYALNQSGKYQATGIDISAEAISNAKKTYGNFFISGNVFDLKEKYDVVCMLELIEHVENPHTFIKTALSLLNPGGTLIITTPNRSWFSKNDIWNTDLPPVHISWFSKNAMNYLFKTFHKKPKFFNYMWYNFFHGTILKPKEAKGVRQPIFNENGKLLSNLYEKSSLRKIAERLHVYQFLKNFMKVKVKVFELFTVLCNPSRLSLKESSTLCVYVRM